MSVSEFPRLSFSDFASNGAESRPHANAQQRLKVRVRGYENEWCDKNNDVGKA